MTALEQQGFEPLHNYTGLGDDLGCLWPSGFARDVRMLGNPEVDADLAWFVRSPWPSIQVREVIRLLNWWARFDEVDWQQRAREFLALPEALVHLFKASLPAPDS